MAPNDSDRTAGAERLRDEADEMRAGRRKAARYVVPVAVVGVAAATIGLVPALADSGDPSLPKITAQQLVEKIAKSDVQQLSGTVKISTDLGLPDLGGLENSLMSGAAQGDGGSSADPQSKLMELASGTHTLRVAADGPDKGKVSLLESAAEYSVIRNGNDVWAYDSKSNEVYHSKAPASDERRGAAPKDVPSTPKELADEALKSVDDTTSVTVDGTAQVAGRDAYKLLIKPRQSGSTVGAISVAVDAKTGVPLKFTLTPAGGGAAVVDAGFTKVDFSRPAASTFDFTPPKGAKVTEGDDLGKELGNHADKGDKGDKGANKGEGRHGKLPEASPKPGENPGKGLDGMKTIGEGWSSIVEFDTGGQGVPSGSASDNSPVSGFLDSLGDHVSGKFGSGTVFSTRLINALITDDGKVYAGAVTKSALVKAADAAQ
ncbi:outer membrane lipoprotein carrier protein LolA [Streptomyces sp. RPA4-2]|uniref:LolA family protein n=1 Tax=Streptomyces sp. RPA4-2 TaxID=2721244 RepID=UPI00143E9F40|nr:outer membrane lipoprotein carrier protein LolA [Streptomyces sp. RPA4-2]QIY64044.1 outer membrane lipoprotein carrier protein LolA [Streptomyces sp. RPA4-2]